MTQIKIEIGQKWRSDDNPAKPRNLVVEKVTGNKAICRNLESGKKTAIRIDRMKPGSRGYSLVTAPKLPKTLHATQDSNITQFLMFPDMDVPEKELAYVREHAKYILLLSRYYYTHFQQVLNSLDKLNSDIANIITKAKVPLQAISIISQLK
jgi:hypothetical protein